MIVASGSGISVVPFRMRAASFVALGLDGGEEAASAEPVRDRYALTRAMGSRSFHSSSSLASR
jgi:hypothetical protein